MNSAMEEICEESNESDLGHSILPPQREERAHGELSDSLDLPDEEEGSL
jgi:hypothetical protein